MKLQDDPPLHLCYCLNVHAGEAWAENFAAIREKALAVKRMVAPGEPFGIGLRLSRAAAETLGKPEELEGFRQFLERCGLYVFTINGFVYGQFHGASLKRTVYEHDWRTSERLDYTLELAEILAALLPEGMSGSISTVPVSHKAWVKRAEDAPEAVENLASCAAGLAELRERTGKDVCLALEPEPECTIESTDEALALFAGPLAGAEAGRHLGVCVDTCHLAVQFEDPRWSMGRLREAGIRIGKVQLSSALRAEGSPAAIARLGEFAESVYLHQVRVRAEDGSVAAYEDLPEALEARAGKTSCHEEWRVHFHVPLYLDRYGPLESTGSLLSAELAESLRAGATQQVEIETYTFDVLPEAARQPEVTRHVVKEYEWALKWLGFGRREGKSE